MAKKSGILFAKGSPILQMLGVEFLESSYSDPASSCAYCGKAVTETNSTEGRGPTRTFIEQEPIKVNGKVVAFEEKVKFSAKKILTCSDCCLKLVSKYKTDPKGGILLDDAGEPKFSPNRTKFPETVG